MGRLFVLWFLVTCSPSYGLDAQKLIERAEKQSLGESFKGQLKMTIHRADGDRELEILSWTEGRDKAVVKVLKPAKDRGVANLRLGTDLWQYLPNVERTIKIPASLMLQSWMGSDFTNDDLVKASRVSRDYTCKELGRERIGASETAKLECLPHPNAPVVWGKLILWIDPTNAVIAQQDFFSENGEHLKRMKGEQPRKFGTHEIASRLHMESLKKQTQTTLIYVDAQYDQKIDPSIFQQSYLKAPLREKN